MATAYRRRPVRPPEIAFVTTIAVVSLFTLYNFGKNHVGYEYHDATQAALALRALEEPDQEVREEKATRRVKLTFGPVSPRS